MPQPFNTILNSDSYELTFSPDALEKEPALAVLIATIIARHSTIEAALGRLFIKMLGANVDPAFAMYNVLITSSTKNPVIQAAADTLLSGDDLDAFNAIMRVVRSDNKERHKLAHWCWGISPQAPNALLLINPANMHEQEIKMDRFHRSPQYRTGDFEWEEMKSAYSYDLSAIYVYRENDLTKMHENMLDTARMIGLFSRILAPLVSLRPFPVAHSRDELYGRLNSLARFREALSPTQQEQKNNPQSPP